MRIAQVAPLFESVPPTLYGGTERVVSYLTESLVQRGHHVTLFASGDSKTQAELIPGCATALRLHRSQPDHLPYQMVMLEEISRRASDFDVIHTHMDYLSFPLGRRWQTPMITTLHGRLDLPDLAHIYKEFREMPLISISDAQRLPLPWANWQTTVYHGLPIDDYALVEKPDPYLAFLGRISPEKRVDRAIKLAERVRLHLKIAAKVDRHDIRYFENEIKPLLEKSPNVEFLGEIDQARKRDFLGHAMALMFLIDWPEPFGLVMIEAMACGTPVIAQRRGSIPEIIEDGVTGFIVETEEEAVRALERLPELDRRTIRERFVKHFSADRMTDDYLKAYQDLLENASQAVGIRRR